MLSSICGDFYGDAELSCLTIEQPVAAMDYERGGVNYGGGGQGGGFNNSLNWELPRYPRVSRQFEP